MTQRVGNIWPLCDGRKGLSVQVAEGVKGWRFDGVFGVAKHVGGRHRLLQEQFFRTVSCRWWYGSARYGRLPAKKTARVLRVCNGYWGWAATRQPGRCSINKALIAVAAEAAPGRGKTIGRIRLRHIPDTTRTTLRGFIGQAIEPGGIARQALLSAGATGRAGRACSIPFAGQPQEIVVGGVK